MCKLYFGIDTSNYRTSVAAVDSDSRILYQKAVLLDVPEGKRGLRQSDVFFMHSNRLPGYFEELFGLIDPANIRAVGVSERPRRVEGSYMPCFLAGVNAAREIASVLRVPVYGFSHQEGHAAAVMESRGNESVTKISGGNAPAPDTLFFHLSGGTTEALLCSPDEKGYSMEIVGGTRDISAGQLLDRFGVAMGMPFPSGSRLDKIAYEVLEKACFDANCIKKTGVIPKLKQDEGWFNLSGAETRLMRYAGANDYIKKGSNVDISAGISAGAEGILAKDVTAELFAALSGLLIDTAYYLKERYRANSIFMAGGVASSRTFRAIIEKRGLTDIHFGAPELSGDNAVGTALLAKRIHESK